MTRCQLSQDVSGLWSMAACDQCCGAVVPPDAHCWARDASGLGNNALVLNTYMKVDVTVSHLKCINGQIFTKITPRMVLILYLLNDSYVYSAGMSKNAKSSLGQWLHLLAKWVKTHI